MKFFSRYIIIIILEQHKYQYFLYIAAPIFRVV